MAGGKGNIRAQSAVKDVLGVVADSNQYNAADARLAISILEQRTETAGGLGMQEHLPTALSQEKSESQSPQLPRSTVNAHISRGDSSPYSGSSEQRERPQTGHGMSGGKETATQAAWTRDRGGWMKTWTQAG